MRVVKRVVKIVVMAVVAIVALSWYTLITIASLFSAGRQPEGQSQRSRHPDGQSQRDSRERYTTGHYMTNSMYLSLQPETKKEEIATTRAILRHDWLRDL